MEPKEEVCQWFKVYYYNYEILYIVKYLINKQSL